MSRVWQHVPGKTLLALINLMSAVALIFEGYNQGVYGTVSSTPGFIKMADIGHDSVVTDSIKQGGLAAAYYFGGMWGCFAGGWAGDRFGRKRAVMAGTWFGMLGAALQAGSQNANMFICGRVVAGLGIGFVNTVVLPWVSELCESHDRGSSFSIVFMANFLGIAIASWINFGVRNSGSAFQWRFPLAWMIIPLVLVNMVLPFLPESPRWLVANGKSEQAVDILCKLRGDLSPSDGRISAEIEELNAVIRKSHHRRNNMLNIFLGGRHSGKLHLGRRAVLGFALQWIQQWTGILAVVSWAGVIFKLSGFDSFKSLWLAALVNTLGVPATGAAALVIDRIGRVRSLLVSFVIQGISLFLLAALLKTSQDKIHTDPESAGKLGTAGSCFVFVYLWFFCMFNIVPSWIYGTEIWPQEIRAQGYSFTIFGWATGCGMTQFVIPILLDHLGWATFIFFGAMNIVVFPIVWLIYPEVAGKSLEDVSLLFASDSILASENIKEYHRLKSEAGGNIALAVSNLLSEVEAGASANSSGSDNAQKLEDGTDKSKEQWTEI